MAQLKLTKTVVEGLQPSAREQVIWDATLPGFGVRVKPTGVRSYVVQYRTREDGTSRRMTIGQHGPRLTFEQAKKQARALLADAGRGQDPVSERRSKRQAPTLSDLAGEYLDKYAVPKKRPKSVRDDRAMLDNIVLPRLGSQKVAAIGRREIESLHAALRDRPYQANRVLALLSKMFNLAHQWGWRTDNPLKGIKRYDEDKRDRWLQDDELRQLCAVLDAHPNQRACNAVRLQLLTGARLGEVLNARWADFDLDRGVWTRPSHQTKQKRTEHLPLSPQAVALVASMLDQSEASQVYLFPGNVAGEPLRDIKKFWASAIRQAGIANYRRHDNRHTYASHLVSSGLSLEVVGRLLGHTNPSTTKRYAHLADDPLRAATGQFGSKVAGLRGAVTKGAALGPDERSR
jgi:integrase